MIPVTYARYELVRAVRNGRFFIFSLVFPLVLFLLVAGPTSTRSWPACRSPSTT